MPTDSAPIVIVGASLAGLRAAEGLRRAGHDGPITLIGAEDHLPYNRPPLSKQLLTDDDWNADQVTFRDDTKVAELDLDLRLGATATALDPVAHRVALADGDDVGYSQVVLATGAHARRLPGTEGIDGIFVLRTLDDALALRQGLVEGARVVVIGAGFIGMEVAASARTRGCDVTVIEALPAPLVRGLGAELGRVVERLHTERGVDVRCNTRVDGFETEPSPAGAGRVTGVRLADGGTVPADVVLVGIGAAPTTAWLEGSGLTIDDGVVCDEYLAAVAVEDVWVVGDVARWAHPGYDDPVRFEHWTTAADHGAAVAANLLAAPSERTPHGPVPFVWSDQYDTKIQIAGRIAEGPVEVIRGDIDDGQFVAVSVVDGVVSGGVGFREPRWSMMLRMAMEKGPLTLDDAREVAGG